MPNSDAPHYSLGRRLATTGEPVEITAGTYLFGADGELRDARLSLQMRLEGDTWVDVVDHGKVLAWWKSPLAASPIYLPAGAFRCFLSGGNHPSINATLFKIA